MTDGTGVLPWKEDFFLLWHIGSQTKQTIGFPDLSETFWIIIWKSLLTRWKTPRSATYHLSVLHFNLFLPVEYLVPHSSSHTVPRHYHHILLIGCPAFKYLQWETCMKHTGCGKYYHSTRVVYVGSVEYLLRKENTKFGILVRSVFCTCLSIWSVQQIHNLSYFGIK